MYNIIIDALNLYKKSILLKWHHWNIHGWLSTHFHMPNYLSSCLQMDDQSHLEGTALLLNGCWPDVVGGKWSWKMRATNIFMLEQHLMPDYAHPAHPRPQKHAHQQKGHCLPHDLCPSHLQPTQPFYQFPSRRMHMFPYHTTAQK